MEGKSRPIGVTVIAVLMLLSGVGTLVSSVPTMSQDVSTLQILVNVMFAAVMAYVAWGLFTLKPWAWATAMLVQVLNAVFAVVSIAVVGAFAGGWIAIGIAAAVLFYLTRPHVRAAFGRLPIQTRRRLF